MAGNKQRKSSSSFFSMFNIFGSKKSKGGYYDAYDSGYKIWHSDDDNGCLGVAEPDINMKAEAFILKCKKRISESECRQIDPAPDNA